MTQDRKRVGLSVCIVGLLVVGACLGFTVPVKSALVKETIFECGFESWNDDNNIPDGFVSNTGWLENYYGSAHSGSGWAFSWAAGDTLTTETLTFGENSTLSFYYTMENNTVPMILEVYIDETTLLWSNINELITLNYKQAVVDLSAYQGNHTISFVGNTSGMYGQLLDDILITSYVEDTGEPSGDDDDDTTPPVENIPPVADLSKGEPYEGVTNEDVLFDGSLSYDSDGEIVKWFWSMGDGNKEAGETIIHQYENPGTYTVVLNVLDDGNAVASDTTNVTITEGNRRPSLPVIKMESIPRVPTIFEITNTNNEIAIIISSLDKDNDTLCFDIDWGDTINETTEYVASGDRLDVTHSYDMAGRYNVTVIARDIHNATSNPNRITVFINLKVKYITDNITGFLIDYADNGTYSKYFDADSKLETSVQREDGHYLIDYDNTGTWDYTYSETTGLEEYQYGNGNQSEDNNDKTPGYEMIIFFLALVLCLFLIRKRR